MMMIAVLNRVIPLYSSEVNSIIGVASFLTFVAYDVFSLPLGIFPIWQTDSIEVT